jgi:4-hydroxybenzoyl-CoA thioesterase
MAYRARLKVRFGDIDQAGVVYYPRFLHYFHVAMEELFTAEVGLDYARVLLEHRFALPAVHLEVDFRRPLRYGDVIDVDVRVVRVGRASVEWRYAVHRLEGPEPVATGRVVTAGIDLDSFASREVPDWLRDALERHVDPPQA